RRRDRAAVSFPGPAGLARNGRIPRVRPYCFRPSSQGLVLPAETVLICEACHFVARATRRVVAFTFYPISPDQSQSGMEQTMCNSTSTPAAHRLGLVGRKVGMTRIFTEEGESIPVTVLDVSNNL